MELRNLYSGLRNWWWLVALTSVMAASSSLYAVSRQPPIYEARSALMLGQALNNPNPTGNEVWLSQQLIQTYVDLAKRNVVRQGTMESLGLNWLPDYEVTSVPNTQVIELRVVDSNPERAAAVTNELARQLIIRSPTVALEQENQGRQSFITEQLDDLEEQINSTKTEIEVKQSELGDFVSASQIANSQSEIQALQAKLATLQANYASLMANSQQGAINSLSIFEPALPPENPIGPNKQITVIAATAIGLLLGIGAAYTLEYLDDTVKTPDDIKQLVDLPTLSAIASYSTNGTKQQSLITHEQPRSLISEEYRSLRTAILFADIDKQVHSILVTSPNPGDGKSVTTANLGTVLAQSGKRVLIIDADLRRPVQHEIFGIPTNNSGLTNLLLEAFSYKNENGLSNETIRLLKGYIKITSQENVYLLTSGSLPPNPAELIGSEKMNGLIEQLTKLFDVVLLDSPPILAVTDAAVLGARTDNVLLVCNSGDTRGNELKQAVKKLGDVKANVIGVVLNHISPKTGGHYYNHYYSSRYYEESSDLHSDEGSKVGGKLSQEKKIKHRWLPTNWF